MAVRKVCRHMGCRASPRCHHPWSQRPGADQWLILAGPGRLRWTERRGILRLETEAHMPPERPKLPSEAIELYNWYIHGEISRRDFLNGAKRFAVAGLTVGAVVDALMPDYVSAQPLSKTDDRIKASYVTVPSPQGNGNIKGYLVRPFSADTREATPAKLPGILVVHQFMNFWIGATPSLQQPSPQSGKTRLRLNVGKTSRGDPNPTASPRLRRVFREPDGLLRRVSLSYERLNRPTTPSR